MRKIWDKIVTWFTSFGLDKWMHFSFGLIIAAFFAVVIKFQVPLFWAVFFGIAKEIFDGITTKKFDWKDLLATAIGGAVIQVFCLIALLC